MFEMPSPYRRPSCTNAFGWNPGTSRSHGSRPEYDVSMWPLNIRLLPPPVPRQVPSALARPFSTCCHCTASPSSSKSSTMRRAIASSSPVKLWMSISDEALSTSRSLSTCTVTSQTFLVLTQHKAACPARISPAHVRQDLLAEQADLLQAILAPQLQHDVRAARVLVFLDRGDAVGRRAGDRLAFVEDRVGHLRLGGKTSPLLHRLRDRADLVLLEAGEVEQRVSRALDVLHLVRQVHACDLTRAVAARVAVGRVDRRDDRAAD